MITACLAVLRRDLMLALRRKTEVLTAVFFYVVVASALPPGHWPRFQVAAPDCTGYFVGRGFAGQHVGVVAFV